jgi:CRP/FNR family transcriptional regulator
MKFAARDGAAARTLAFSARTSNWNDSSYTAGNWQRVSSTSPATPYPLSVPKPIEERPAQPAPGKKRTSSWTTVSYARGQEIFPAEQGAGLIYIVRTGCVRLFKILPDRRTINLGLLGPNTVFTPEDLGDGIATGACAEALVDSTISVVPASELAEIIAASPELASAIVTGMSRRFTELHTLVEQLLVRDTGVRLATTLLALAAKFGRPTADGLTAISLPLTHQGLANMIGSNRVTVTRKLLELQSAGSIRTLARNSIAIDPQALDDFIHSTSSAQTE